MSNKDLTFSSRVVTSGGVAGRHPVREVHSALVGPSTGAEFNAIELDFAPEACVRFDDVRFEFDSSFIGPEAKTELKLLGRLHNEDPSRPASVFGHADPSGDDEYNKKLSGRRAQAMYGLLTRKTELWEDLFKTPLPGGDNWGTKSVQTMLKTLGHYGGPVHGVNDAATQQAIKDFQSSPAGEGLTPDGSAGPQTRPKLYKAYMQSICVDEDDRPFQLDPVEGFLARGADAKGKGDFQGCSEFNPDMVFSKEEAQRFKNPANKAERDRENKINRRVVVFLFRSGSEVKPEAWPCPRAKEGTPGCRKRFHSDGEARRSTNTEERRLFDEGAATFACNFYDRIALLSPCEKGRAGGGLFHMQCLSGDGSLVLAQRKYQIRGTGGPTVEFEGVLDETGTLRHVRVPPGDYVLTVQGCGEDTPITVLRDDEQVQQIRMLENGRLAVHVLTPGGDPILNAVVAVEGVGQRLTDGDGLAYFNTVEEGEFSFVVSKPGLRSARPEDPERLSLVRNVVVGPGETVGEGGETATGKVKVGDTRTDVIVTLDNKKPVVAKILRVEARQSGTQSLRNPNSDFLVENRLAQPSAPSDPAETDLGKNPPVVLVRGSRPVFFKAVTEPPGQMVTWEVVPNQSAGPAPDFDPKQTLDGLETQVQTDKTGSFSVTAKLGTSAVVWNLVLVGVDVDITSPSTVRDSGLMDLNEFAQTPEGKKVLTKSGGSLPDPTQMTGVVSGLFEFGKHAWSSEVRVTLKGGGTSGTLGCDQVSVHILQNEHEEATRGLYASKIAFTQASFPLLDAPQGSPPDYDGPTVGAGVSAGGVVFQSPFLHSDGMFKLTKNDPTSRVMLVGDSPAVGFPNTAKDNGGKLERIDRETRFRAAVVSFSKHSKNALVAHADLFWHVNWTGDVSMRAGIGKWSSDGANVKVTQDWKPILSSSGVQGTDVRNALLEIFGPLASTINNNPKEFVNKP